MRSMRCSLETVAMIVCGLYTNPLKIASPAAWATHCSNHVADAHAEEAVGEGALTLIASLLVPERRPAGTPITPATPAPAC